MHSLRSAIAVIATCSISISCFAQVSLTEIGRYESGIFDDSAAEIVAHDAATQRLFVTNAADNTIDILDINDPTDPSRLLQVDLNAYGGGPNSVAVHDSVVAVAVEADEKTDRGSVVFFDTAGNFINSVEVGALPDMLTFSNNGRWLLVANEGEPNDDYSIDPEGSVTVINMRRGAADLRARDVRTADFRRFNQRWWNVLGVRIYGPGASVAQDLEPEYITIDDRNRYAYVTLQENNAVAVIDIRRARVQRLIPLWFKRHDRPGNQLDVSNRDDEINIQNWPVLGMYQPDAIASVRVGWQTFFITANEGDARDYDGFSEEARVKDIELDARRFPDAASLQEDENLGRLKITTANGDFRGDGDFEALFAYGVRSFSIWSSFGWQVYDSGSQFERITAQVLPDNFNSTNDENDSFDNRSDDKGPEPEALTVGQLNGRTYAFIGLERVGGIMVYDISNPFRPTFELYTNNREFSGDPQQGTAGDLGPESIVFIEPSRSPSGKALIVVANEVSGSTTIYEFEN